MCCAEFNPQMADYQFVEQYDWIPAFGITYHIGIDGISLFLVLLTTILITLSMLYSGGGDIEERPREFCFFMLVLETGLLGALLAVDLFLFYVFWEVMLIPMYFLIGIWGHGRKIYAAIKFVLFTMVGSFLMLAAILYLVYSAHVHFNRTSFDLPLLYQVPLTVNEGRWLFAAFALAFAIKVPMWPVHTWLPDAHTNAPTAGSVILAGVMLKMGTYGFLRFAIPLFPTVAVEAIPLFMALAVIGIIYGALVAMMQPDLKRLIAYSSVSHLGFVMLGIFALNPAGYRRRDLPDAQSRRFHRRIVFAGRNALPATPYARDFRVRRFVEARAGLRRDLHDRDAVVDRAARAQRLRRRVSDHARRVHPNAGWRRFSRSSA